MAYTKTNWVDRVVQKPLTYTLQTNGDGTTTLIPAEGTIVASGTPLTSTALNNLEKQYDEAINYVNAPPVTWTTLTLQPGYGVNNSRPPKFTKQGNTVTVIGELLNATGIVGYLPVGFRPKQHPLTFRTSMATGGTPVDSTVAVGVDGSVNILANGNSTSGISLAGITFIAEQ